MEKVTKLAIEGETWIFFDEINTSDHIGILGSLISHRLLKEKKIHPNIRLFAACNPYRFRTEAQSNTMSGTMVISKQMMNEITSRLCSLNKFNYSQHNNKNVYPETRSLVLALSLCYLLRLHDPSQRKEY
ncbi:43447_t:CDS:2 [Gigaspora margarita]|uniref:43447_t:CDS:1 n=1 Tax=Gigaspora margarita TaxID=4874 RepID=A0ABN7UKY0_GIGMA|nr:43447_t:CDS:2 [Gigaspora margarita]